MRQNTYIHNRQTFNVAICGFMPFLYVFSNVMALSMHIKYFMQYIYNWFIFVTLARCLLFCLYFHLLLASRTHGEIPVQLDLLYISHLAAALHPITH